MAKREWWWGVTCWTAHLERELIRRGNKKSTLEEFGQFPVVLKRIEGCMGEYVDKADDTDSAIDIVKKFWEKGEDKFPILAQEYIDSDSYRVLTIGKNVEQTAVKTGTSWKNTGVYSKKFEKFEIDAELQKILDKIIPANDIVFCGYDFAKKNGQWLLIEINAHPAYDFFDSEYDHIIERVLLHLKKLADHLRS